MKPTLIILSLAFTYSCCNCPEYNQEIKKAYGQKKEKKSEIEVKAIQKGVYNYYYLFDIKLINNTDSDFSFFTMSCMSVINIVTDPKDAAIMIPKCGANYETVINLKPNQEYSIPVIFSINPDLYHIRFGFIVYQPKNAFGQKKPVYDYYKEFKKKKEKLENVIWSSPVTLSASNLKLYEIRNIINDTIFSIVRKN